MKKTRALSLLIILAFLALGGTSCAQQPDQYPSVWIDHPQDGGVFPVGVPVTVISHAFARAGVAEVVLSINGEPYRRDAPAEAGQDFVSLQQDWVPGEAGIYILFRFRLMIGKGRWGIPTVFPSKLKGILQRKSQHWLIHPSRLQQLLSRQKRL